MIYVLIAQVAFGEHIRLVGEKPELGSWEIAAAPELSWNEGDIWSGNIIICTTRFTALRCV